MKKFPKLKWFLPLFLMLGLKALMMSALISGIIGSNVAAATGVIGERVSVSGLNVDIDGYTTDAAAQADKAIVEDDVAWTADVTVNDTPVAAGTAAPSAVKLAATSSQVVLTGVLATGAEQTGLVEAARAEFEPGREVIDNTTVDPDVAIEGSGEVLIEGLADDDSQKAEWIASATAVAAVNGFDVVDDVEVAEAEVPEAEEPDTVDDLNALFELEPIEFDTSQATIRPESQVTLDEAAELIAANPDAGSFRVVGHTDSDGSDGSNQTLSDARAQAVVDYLVNTGGVDAGRLEAEGRGESELKVTPEESAEDRQENRRIEWELIS